MVHILSGNTPDATMAASEIHLVSFRRPLLRIAACSCATPAGARPGLYFHCRTCSKVCPGEGIIYDHSDDVDRCHACYFAKKWSGWSQQDRARVLGALRQCLSPDTVDVAEVARHAATARAAYATGGSLPGQCTCVLCPNDPDPTVPGYLCRVCLDIGFAYYFAREDQVLLLKTLEARAG